MGSPFRQAPANAESYPSLARHVFATRDQCVPTRVDSVRETRSAARSLFSGKEIGRLAFRWAHRLRFQGSYKKKQPSVVMFTRRWCKVFHQTQSPRSRNEGWHTGAGTDLLAGGKGRLALVDILLVHLVRHKHEPGHKRWGPSTKRARTPKHVMVVSTKLRLSSR